MPDDELADAVDLTDAKAIRAIAHPARLVVIDALYDRNGALTATQAAELAGTSPSAMSYHLRALERYGIVRRAAPSEDGRERPWVRAARDLRIRPNAASSSKAATLATNAVLATALDVVRERMLAALERGGSDAALPLDAATGFSTTAVLVTAEEAEALMLKVREVIEPLRAEHRTDPPDGAGRLTVFVGTAPDPDPTTTRS